MALKFKLDPEIEKLYKIFQVIGHAYGVTIFIPWIWPSVVKDPVRAKQVFKQVKRIVETKHG